MSKVKMNSNESYYTTLGIEEDASSDEIKKAYRKLSLKYHPDRNQGDIEKVKIFQQVNEAYETLSDPEKKMQYDMSRKSPFSRMHNNGDGFHGMDIPIDELFSSIFFGGIPGGMPGGMGGIHGMPGMFANFQPGANIRVFRNGVPVNIGQQALEKPSPIVKTLTINMETVLTGGKIPMEVERWLIENGHKVFEKTTIYVDVFKGIDHNEIILLREQGNILNETCKGDVKVFVEIVNNTQFVRNGLDLIMDKNISLKEALCGFSFDMKYINGKVYTINNQEGNIISPEYKKVIPGMGLTRDGHTGNMIIHFHVVFPETLTKEEVDILSKTLP